MLSHHTDRHKVRRKPASTSSPQAWISGTLQRLLGPGTDGDVPTPDGRSPPALGMGGWGRRPEGSWQRASKKIKLRPALVPKHQGRPHRRFCRLDSAASWTGPPLRWTPCQGESRNPERGRTQTETETPARRAIRSHTHGFGAVSLPGGGGG